MLCYRAGNYPINDHCWIDGSNIAAASGNLIKFYRFDGCKWTNTYSLKLIDTTILKVKCYRASSSKEGYLVVSGLQTLCTISLIDYGQNVYNFDFWILNFEKKDNLIVTAHSDSSINLLSFPELKLIQSFHGNPLTLATSAAISILPDHITLVYTKINSISEYRIRGCFHKNHERVNEVKNPHRGLVYNSKFIYDGKYIATASEDLSVIIWSSSSLEVKCVLDHSSKVWDCLAVDCLIVTCTSNGSIHQWNMNGELMQVFSARAPVPITNLSCYGNFISAGSQDGNLLIRPLKNNVDYTEYTLEDCRDWVRSITVYNDVIYILTSKGLVLAERSDSLESVETPIYSTTSGTFGSTALAIALDMAFVGDLEGQIHVFPIIGFKDGHDSYKVLKCFSHRVGSVILTCDTMAVTADNLGNAAIIDFEILKSKSKHIFIQSHKLPYVKRYGKITSGLIIGPTFIVFGDEFGNIYHGIISNMKRVSAHISKVTSLALKSSFVYSCSADGIISQWSSTFELVRKIKVEHMDHLYYINLDTSIYVLGFKGTRAIYYNVDYKIELWTVDCGGPRRPIHFSSRGNSFRFIYSNGPNVRICVVESKGYSLNPWFPYDDLYSGIWTDSGLLIGGKDGYIRNIATDDSKDKVEVSRSIPFSTHVRCISVIDDAIAVGGIGIIKFYDNKFLEFMILAVKEGEDLDSLRVNFVKKACDLLICGLSNSTLLFYSIDFKSKTTELRCKQVLEYTPLTCLSTPSSIYIGTSRGFVTVFKIENHEGCVKVDRANHIKIHESGINGIVVADGNLISCGDDQKLVLTSIDELAVKSQVRLSNSIRCVASFNGYILSAGWDLLLQVWNIDNDRLVPLHSMNLLFKPRAIIVDSSRDISSGINIAVLGAKGNFDLYSFTE